MAAKPPTAARAADQGCITSQELIPTVAISGEVLPPPSREAIKRNAADLLRAMRDLIAGNISPTEGERIAAASRACSAARDGSPRSLSA